MSARLSVFETVVHEVVQETPDTVTLVLDVQGHHRDYLPGQFVSLDPGQFPALRQWVTFFEHKKQRKEQVRAYSMASTPDEPHVAITVKEEPFEPAEAEYPCLLSPYLVYSVRPGDRVTVKGYTGSYAISAETAQQADHLVHVVAGSGVVPNFAMVKWGLAHLPSVRHTFVYSNKTWDDVIFRRQLEELERAHPDRLEVVHCLTREKERPAAAPRSHLSRINAEILRAAIPDPSRALVLACGPAITRWDRKAAQAKGEEPKPRFLETLKELLREVGVPKERFHQEAYG
jgi:3-ketosteroid 9alpha-monooxygenase subunit B